MNEMKETHKSTPIWLLLLKGLFSLLAAALCIALVAALGAILLLSRSSGEQGKKVGDPRLLDYFDHYMTNQLSDSLGGVASIEKAYWLDDHDIIAPEPDPTKFGTATDPGELAWLIEAAQPLLDGQSLTFSTETKVVPGSQIHYYLDETILSITWKEYRDGVCYTFSEVKIKHPSQIRRFLADDTYGSSKHYYGSDMARKVNAVTASNADFYKYRHFGYVVYHGQTFRGDPGQYLDTCFLDDQGRMLMVPRGQLRTVEAVQAFVEENHIRFSLSFGPILVQNGQLAVPAEYATGEIKDRYARAALGDLGSLHYLLAVTSFDGDAVYMPTTREFARVVCNMGCANAYSLDGGQTAMIFTNDQVINTISYGQERLVSDIIYFATAVPSGD